LGLALDEPGEKDQTITTNEIEVIYSKMDEMYIDHSIIDYENSSFGQGFTVRSQLSSSC